MKLRLRLPTLAVAGTALGLAMAAPAYANLLTFSTLAVAVPQSVSDPCVICATQQAHNPIDFGFNNFVSNGQTSTGNFFSTNLVGGTLASGDEVDALPYTVGQIGAALLDNFSFGVAIDVNSAEGADPMTLDLFRLWKVDAQNNNLTLLSYFDGPQSMPDIRPGNGKGDYLLSGFNLSGLGLGDRLIFQAAFSGASDGGESFYLVAQPTADTPIPAALPMFVGAIGGVGAFARWRKRKTA
jgi:hypothetical protein